MNKLPIKNIKGDKVGDYDFPAELIVSDKGDQAVHESIVAFQSHQRAGTASTLNKSDVAGSGKKPWKQKGLGRARVGYKQNPIWRGGSVAHGPHPRTYKKKVSKKVAKLAFRRAFSAKVNQEEITVIDDLILDMPKTKNLINVLNNLDLLREVLIITDIVSENILLASRNIQHVEVIPANLVSTYKLLRYRQIVITQAGMEVIKNRLI